MAVCKRIATSRVYPKIPSCEIGDGAVGCCRISEVDEGAKGVSEREREREEEVEASEARAEEEKEKDPNIRVPSYKQGG